MADIQIATLVLGDETESAGLNTIASNMNSFLKRLLLMVCYPQSVELYSNRLRVISGPFRGMKYLAPRNGNSFSPKVLGTYENELAGVISQILDVRLDRIVDIGAAEGYYAVGLALTHPTKPEVIAYEADADEQAMISELADMNGTPKVTVLGLCEAKDLASVMKGNEVTLVICDTEGYERELLDPEAVPALRHAWILVELHDFVHHGIKEMIADRFRNTHQMEELSSRERGVEDVPRTARLGGLIPKSLLVRAMREHRPEVMQWLWMKPNGTEAERSVATRNS